MVKMRKQEDVIDQDERSKLRNLLQRFVAGEISSDEFVRAADEFSCNDSGVRGIVLFFDGLCEDVDCFRAWYVPDMLREEKKAWFLELAQRCSDFLHTDFPYMASTPWLPPSVWHGLLWLLTLGLIKPGFRDLTEDDPWPFTDTQYLEWNRRSQRTTLGES